MPRANRLVALVFGLATLVAGACVGYVAPSTVTGGAGAGGATGAAGAAGSGAGVAGGAGVQGTGAGAGGAGGQAATGGAGRGGAGAAAGAGSQAGGSAAGRGGAGAGGGAAATGAAGSTAVERDHCIYGYDADARDPQIPGNFDEWKASNGDIDLVVPKAVVDWMTERLWQKSHDAWHNIRRCRTGGAPGGGGGVNVCAQTALVPDHQECADAEDGYQFLVMHRHMMQSLRQAFPQHAATFDGFPTFPFNATDVPQQWRGRWGTGWSQQILDVARVLEDIENKLSMFATEGDLGKYIQCGGMASGASSIHGALHFKWVVSSSPHSLGTQAVNIDNYMFWKLHGWIDKIWERYRVAKNLAPTETKLTNALQAQCAEMHQLSLLFDPSTGARPDGGTSPDAGRPVERGYFHENVRPILESATYLCGSSCHDAASPDANLALGGNISSADIVKGLVNVNSAHGGQFKRVVPNNPAQSWLYLKITDMAKNAGCTGTMCNAQVMPPVGRVTVTTADADVIKTWINMGAPAPTQ
jgi:hypothetical protein